MTAQDSILRNCKHASTNPCEVQMGRGEILRVCVECWNASVDARRHARKIELAEYWQHYAQLQSIAMQEVGARPGDRVQYFCRSMLGIGGFLVLGTIVRNRNGICTVKLDQKQNGKTQTEWNKAWKRFEY